MPSLVVVELFTLALLLATLMAVLAVVSSVASAALCVLFVAQRRASTVLCLIAMLSSTVLAQATWDSVAMTWQMQALVWRWGIIHPSFTLGDVHISSLFLLVGGAIIVALRSIPEILREGHL